MKTINNKHVCQALILASFMASSIAGTAHGESVMEIYVGQRPAAADAVIIPLRSALHGDHILATPVSVIGSLTHIPLPATTDEALSANQLVDQLEIGWRSWLHGSYAEAAKQLDAAIHSAWDNPVLVVSDEKAHAAVIRGLVGLALSYNRLGDSARADAAMSELIRSAPLSAVRDLHPDIEKLYNDTNSALPRQGRSRLLITVSNPNAQIFVDGRGVGRGGKYSADELSGKHRVLVEVGQQALRYDVDMHTGNEFKMSINWDLESRLTLTERWVGVTLSANDNISELDLARNFALLGHGESFSIVLGIESTASGLIATGRVYSRVLAEQPGGHKYFVDNLDRSGQIRISKADAEQQIRAFAAFLKNGTQSPYVEAISVPPDSPMLQHITRVSP